MTSQKVFNFIGNLEGVFARKELIRGNSPLEMLMPKVTHALELGKGDARRYGGMQLSTRQAIEDSIKSLAKDGYFAEARACAFDYKELEKQEEQQTAEVIA